MLQEDETNAAAEKMVPGCEIDAAVGPKRCCRGTGSIFLDAAGDEKRMLPGDEKDGAGRQKKMLPGDEGGGRGSPRHNFDGKEMLRFYRTSFPSVAGQKRAL